MRNLADTSGKDWIIGNRKKFFGIFLKKEVICQKPPSEDKKNIIAMLKSLCAQNYQFIFKYKDCR